MSCTNTHKVKEMDYSNYSYDYYKRRINIPKNDERITVFINGRVSTMEKFQKFTSENKIKTFEIVKDSNKIKAMNYPYDKIKVLIFATKK
jgi:hypothetical protein